MRFLTILTLVGAALASHLTARDAPDVINALNELSSQLSTVSQVVSQYGVQKMIMFAQVDDEIDKLTDLIDDATGIIQDAHAWPASEMSKVVATVDSTAASLKSTIALLVSKKKAFGVSAHHVKDELVEDRDSLRDLFQALAVRQVSNADAMGKSIDDLLDTTITQWG